jgi:CRP-like cAMP-binding protein
MIRGCLRIIKYNERNEEIILADICSGGFLGETAIVNERHRVNAVASEFVELLFLEQENLELLIKEDPNLGNKLLLVFLEKLSIKLDKTNRLFQADYILGSSSLSDMD